MNTLVALGPARRSSIPPPGTLGFVPEFYYEAVILIIALVLLGNTLEAPSETEHPPRCAGYSTFSPREPA